MPVVLSPYGLVYRDRVTFAEPTQASIYIMNDPLVDWPRKCFEGTDQRPFLFYVVFGADVQTLRVSRSKHRCDGIPEGLHISSFGPEMRPEVLDSFRTGPLWDELKTKDRELAGAIARQERCAIVQGHCKDDHTLNYLRNTIGLVTCLLEQGGIAVYDPQSLKWWQRTQWVTRVFEPASALPHEHVVILVSDEGDGQSWYHTRGMRKFGRPDLSLHGVTTPHQAAVVDMFHRFIEFQASGGVVAEGQEIQVSALPSGMHCTHGGNEDDPDFNNVHVEIQWPQAALPVSR